MKRRTLVLSLVMALLLVALLPASALAKPASFAAGGSISYISPGTVFPAGDSGRYVVVEREVMGTLAGSISGGFILTYGGNVELLTQAGNVHGKVQLFAADGAAYQLSINGKSQAMTFLYEIAPGIPVFKLTISGHWTFNSGAQGNGAFDAVLVFIPTADGHVATIWPYDPYNQSTLVMTGQWQQ